MEYGTDIMEMHADAIKEGQKVLIVDDLLATGGTTISNIKLVEQLGGIVTGIIYLIELEYLHGREKLRVTMYTPLLSSGITIAGLPGRGAFRFYTVKSFGKFGKIMVY